jgi:hypothetical protein
VKPGIGVHAHRPELQHGEGFHRAADPRLPVKDRARRPCLHEDRDDEEQRQEQGEEGQAAQDVERPLQRLVQHSRLPLRGQRRVGDRGRGGLGDRHGLGVDVEPDREPGRRRRIQPPGELAAHARPERGTAGGEPGLPHVGDGDADHRAPLEPSENVGVALGGGHGLDDGRPQR